VVSVYSVVNPTQGLSLVTSRESNHGTRRTHGNESLLFPWFPCIPWLPQPRDCPWLPAENPTTEHAEHTETRAFFFRGFRVFRGYPNPGTVPGYQPRIQPRNTPNTRKREPSFSVVSVYSVVNPTRGLSLVTSRESNHGTRRTHGNESLLFPWFPCVPWLTQPGDCPWLPAENPTTEHAEHTETRAFFFRGFRVFRG
jgi:hypothetical protein